MEVMVGSTATRLITAKTEGINMIERMEMMYMRMATSRDDEAREVLEERAILIEDLHLMELIDKVRKSGDNTGRQIWTENKMMILKMDGGRRQVNPKLLRPRNMEHGHKGTGIWGGWYEMILQEGKTREQRDGRTGRFPFRPHYIAKLKGRKRRDGGIQVDGGNDDRQRKGERDDEEWEKADVMLLTLRERRGGKKKGRDGGNTEGFVLITKRSEINRRRGSWCAMRSHVKRKRNDKGGMERRRGDMSAVGIPNKNVL